MVESVVNASPVIHLGEAGYLFVLRDLFGTILIPRPVVDEILAKPESKDRISNTPWIRVLSVDPPAASLTAWDLGPGETSVLTYALAHPGTEAVLDDWAARRCAKSLGVPVCGTLGVILRAARKGILSDPVSVLHKVRNAGMWLSQDVFEEVLGLAREMSKFSK